jgi:transketolase
MSHIPAPFDHTDRLVANTLRMLAIEAVQVARSGHPGLPLGAADLAAVLWTRHLKYNPHDPAWPDRDRFVLSAGHGSALLYALLHLSGYEMPLEELKRFRQWGSHTPGHPEYDLSRGVETTTGPLGQGLATAVGMAIAERWLRARFNRPQFPIVDHYTYVLASDGDLMEGISHEAASLAGHLGLGRLIVLYDDNHISIDGPTQLTFSDDVPERFNAYGWHTQRVDGHDMAAVHAALQQAREETEKPSLIACRTHIGYGSPRQDTAAAHGEPLGEEGLLATKKALGWPLEPPFYVPPEAQERFERAAQRGAACQSEWQTHLEAYRETHPGLAEAWDQMIGGELPPGWEENLPDFSGAKAAATRAASGQVLDALFPRLPSLLGGSADLTGSNKTLPKGVAPLSRESFEGGYLHYGVREHAMGAVMNGLALHGGVRPYGGTFLVFSDYMRPAIRLAALMKLPVIYVFTHDSIGLGEDGPTHQPVEHLAALRAIPGLQVLRPADGNETAQAWRMALERRNGPTALILTRQKLPQVTPRDNDLHRGAYILAEAGHTPPDIVLLATGSEVNLALQSRLHLQGEGVYARVVSMPSWELFNAQPSQYQEAVLPPGAPRLALEAGVRQGWQRYVGADGSTIGLDHFGASAPYQVIFEHLGFTSENVAQQAKLLLNQRESS